MKRHKINIKKVNGVPGSKEFLRFLQRQIHAALYNRGLLDSEQYDRAEAGLWRKQQ